MSIEDRHELLCKLKDLTVELGRSPTRRDWEDHVENPWKFEKLFRSWSLFKQAAGIAEEKNGGPSHKKRIQDFYRGDLNKLLTRPMLKDPVFPLLGPFTEMLWAGDLHLPFACERSLQLFYSLVEELKPPIIGQGGDLYDTFAVKKFAGSRLVIDPREEIMTGRQMADDFWKTIRKLSPKSRLIQIKGNHDIRPMRHVIENMAEIEAFLRINDNFEYSDDWDIFHKFFEFEGVETYHDTRTPLLIDGISIIHGFTSPRKHRKKLQTNVLHFHLHRGGVIFEKMDDGVLRFEMDGGYMGDPSRKVFNYTPTIEQNWTRGCSYVSKWGPIFLPFE